jgi:hypothetical protein
MVADGHVLTNSTDITAYLIKHAPETVSSSSSDLLAKIHEEGLDPNFATFMAVS